MKLVQISLLTLALVSAFIPAIALAQPTDLPTPNGDGDYRGNISYRTWITMDTDPNGLNCRWSSEMPEDWVDPRAVYPRRNIIEWTVIRRFTQNTLLVANNDPAGFVILRDEDNKPWLKVQIGSSNQICLVRANSNFIRPFR